MRALTLSIFAILLSLVVLPTARAAELNAERQATLDRLVPHLQGLSSDNPQPMVILHAACEGDLRRSQGMGADFREAAGAALEAWEGAVPPCGLFVEILTQARGALKVADLIKVFQSQPYRPYLYAMRFVGAGRVLTPVDFLRHPRPTGPVAAARAELAWRLKRQDASAAVPADDRPVALVSLRSFLMREGQVRPARYHRVRVEQVQRGDVLRALLAAADWLGQEPWGEVGYFPYSYDPQTDRFSDENYNLLRHLGVVWSLLHAYEASGMQAYLGRAEAGLDWIQRFARQDETSWGKALFLVEPNSGKAKLGGAALWLLALVEHAELTGSQDAAERIRALVLHLLRSQDRQGAFASFHPGPGLVDPESPSEYYPPQALLALLRAKDWVPDIPICQRVELGLSHLLSGKARRLSLDETHFVNQWTVYAVGEMRRRCGVKGYDWFWERELAYLEANKVTPAQDPVLAGAQQVDPVTFDPNPTRLEALTYICSEYRARGDWAQVARCAPLVEEALALQLSLQNGPGNEWVWSNPRRARGGFPRVMKDETLRMDIVQHNLSALFFGLAYIDGSAQGPAAVVAQDAEELQASLGAWLERWRNGQRWGAPRVKDQAKKTELVRSVELNARYLREHMGSAGELDYVYNLFAKAPRAERHQVRQAGGLWALARLTAWQGREDNLQALWRGLRHVLGRLEAGPVEGSLLLRPEEGGYVKTGAQALVCLALLDTLSGQVKLEAGQRRELERALEGLLAGLWWLRRADGHFAEGVYLLSLVPSLERSPYADGEALLALARGASRLKRRDWQKGLRESALRMADAYTRQAWKENPDSDDTKGFFQWGCMAFDELGEQAVLERKLADELILGLAWWQLHVHRLLERKRNIAYGLEGLAVALEVARRNGQAEAVKSLEAALKVGALRIMRLQYSGPRSKENPFLKKLGRLDPRAIGGVLGKEQSGLIRVDWVQHNAFALLEIMALGL